MKWPRQSFVFVRTTFAHPGRVYGDAWHGSGGMGHGTYNGFNHGGVARTFALHAGPTVSGGFHASIGVFTPAVGSMAAGIGSANAFAA